ncbi:hypothetical protein ACFVFS_20360 [Kitasatospora sp. NPDC057692]|uniref:hypothetical protein n=1 Tax=Kitasatospora sp. NPDC057692 TaxID=3346215 RepID=UPI0036C043E9
MRTSTMPASAKNSTATTARRRIAAVAATVVLAGSVQLLTAESSWACGAPAAAEAAPATAGAAPKADTAVHRGGPEAGFHMAPALTVRAGGPKVEIPVEVGNHTGAAYRSVVPTLSLAAHRAGDGEKGVSYLPSGFLTVEYRTTGGWQKLSLVRGCDPTLFATPAKGMPVADGRAEHATFRVGLSADAPADLSTLFVGLSAVAEDRSHGEWVVKDMTVTVPKPAAKPTPAKPVPAKPTPAKPAAPKPTATAPATQAPAKPADPAADRTPAAAPPAPAAPGSVPAAAPAATAPAGTPELAQTGAGTPNGLLAGIAAALAALGAGAVVTARRLRTRG